MKIQIGSFTEKGLRRKQEDAEYAVQSLERTPFCWLAVADGMGGHAHGDDASRTAIESLDNIPTSENGMRRFFDRADYRVTSIGTDLPNSRKRSGPGTTLTAVGAELDDGPLASPLKQLLDNWYTFLVGLTLPVSGPTAGFFAGCTGQCSTCSCTDTPQARSAQ